MEEDIAIIGNTEEENLTTDTLTGGGGGGGHFNNLQLSFTSHEKDGSLHALQTAYSEVKKRLQEQLNKNAVLQTSIRDMELQRLSGGRPNSGVFGAAGPPSEPEQDLQAQYRAEFGFAQSLERQVIRAKSTLSKLESENKQLSKKLNQVEEELKMCKQREIKNSQENSALKIELDRLNSQLKRKDADNIGYRLVDQNQDTCIQELQSQLQDKDKKIHLLSEQLESLQAGQPSLNSTTADERKILEQVERYSKTIRGLKKQVQVQGQMLTKQQEAIRKLIESSKSPSLTPSSTRLAAEGASFFPTHVEAEPPLKTNSDFSFSAGFAETKQLPLVPSFPTLQTMPQTETSQTLEEQFKQINFKKSEEKLLREPTESEYIGRIPGYSSKYSLLVDTENKTSRTMSSCGQQRPLGVQRQDRDETYALEATHFNIDRKKPAPCEDTSMYENLDVVSEKTNSERFRTNVGQISPKSVNQPYNPEHSDYVNLKDLHPTRGGSTFPVISPHVRTLSSDDQTKPYKEPQEHTGRGMSPSAIRIPRVEDTRSRGVPSSSTGQVLQEHTPKPESGPSHVIPPSGGTRPKQVVQKSPSGNSQICPVCGQDFVNISMENFQMHVFHCMDSDSSGECATLQNVSPTNQPLTKNIRANQPTEKDLRICPMCDASYPAEMQSEFERHVQEHFGEEPIIDRFEVLHR